MNFITFILLITMVVDLSYQQQQQQNHGKYCGTLQEIQSPEKFRYYNCYGVVWAMDASRLKMTGFTFQQSLVVPENITFWIGPAVKTGNDLLDMVPSSSGYYLEPKLVPPVNPSWGPPQILIAKKPTAQEVSSILRQSNNNIVAVSASSPSISTAPNQTTPVPEPIPSASNDIKRLPREAAFPERQPVPVAEPPKKAAVLDSAIIPQPESTKNGSTTSVSNVEPTKPGVEPILVQNLATFTGNRIIAEIPNNHDIQTSVVQNSNAIVQSLDQAPRNQSSSNNNNNKIYFPVLSSGFAALNETSTEKRNIIVVADAADSVEKITKTLEEQHIEIDKSLANKINGYDDPFSNKSQLLDSTKKVAIILLFAPGNSTKATAKLDDNLHTHGTTVSLKSDNTVIQPPSETSTISTTATTQTTTTARAQIEKVWKPLSWYSGNDDLYLDLPQGSRMSDFRWLSVYDHTNQQPIATLLLPNGRGFFVPAPLTLKGFKPTLRTKDVHSGPIEILDTKTIRIKDFYFEGDAPGAWFTVGTSLFPTLSGHMVPILKDDGKFDCDYLKAYKNQTVILKLPGAMEASDVFWLSVFCVPYAISFAHVYLPYKDLSVPVSETVQPIPICMLEGSV